MKMNHFAGAAALGLALQLAPAFAADPMAPAGSVERGKQVYMKNVCYSCHGTQGQGGDRTAGPKLAPDPFPFVAFEMQLRQPRGTMPRYPEEFVSKQEAADLYAYIASIPAGPKADALPLLRR
jgi:mono/diheme cytochrome c family protein